MMDIEKQIEDAIIRLSLDQNQIRRLPSEEASHIVQVAQRTFVEGQPRTWWLSLKVPHTAVEYTDASGFRHIPEHWRLNDVTCWFIPETEEQVPPVYETNIQVLPRILEECSFFEYYVLSKDFSFLLIETDHNQIISAKAA
jgi:hypothetical protein